MRQIAYVGEVGQIRIHDLDSGTETPVSELAAPDSEATVVHNWPTWSPDGRRLAFFRYTLAGGEVREAAVWIAPTPGASPVPLYRAGTSGLIYMSWSPDGLHLAILLQEEGTLTLRVVDVQGRHSPLTVAQGAPLYSAWQPDSQGLVAHVGVSGSDPPRSNVQWIRFEDNRVTQVPLDRRPAPGFRAPSWSRSLGGATVALRALDATEIALQTGPEAEPEILVEAGPAPAFSWSPDGESLAYAARPSADTFLYQGISLYRPGDRTTRQISDEPLLAFFWCPDSRRLVYSTGDLGNRMIGIHSVDVDGGSTEDLGWLRPSRDMWLLLGHFDQYSQSAHLFSPDGAEIVFATSRAQERHNGSVPTVRQILVRPIEGTEKERVIARGRLAFWRPA
jgi:TolB protein